MRFQLPTLAALLLATMLGNPQRSQGGETTIQIVQATNLLIRPTTWAVKLTKPNLSNLHQVTTNLYRGAQPSSKGMAELKAMGVKTVVNLRRFHSDKDELTGTDLKQSRLQMDPWHAEDEDVIGFLKIAADTNSLPIFVHCQRGADRTGMMCAMYRVVICNWTKEEAIREMKEGGFNFYPGWKKIVRYVEKADIEKLRERAGLSNSRPSKSVPSK
jgi:protein tyrosine/serine phosphatase